MPADAILGHYKASAHLKSQSTGKDIQVDTGDGVASSTRPDISIRMREFSAGVDQYCSHAVRNAPCVVLGPAQYLPMSPISVGA